MNHDKQKSLMHDIPRSPLHTLGISLKRFGPTGTITRYLTYRQEIRDFITCPSPYTSEKRQQLLRQFAHIQGQIDCAHGPGDYVLITRMILASQVRGPIVECGAFKGGSTAKLSLVAQLTRRQLYVCDSFNGLPELTGVDKGLRPIFDPNQYTGTLGEVKRNVKRFGAIKPCTFVPGFFNRSLTDLSVHPAFVIMDVDLVSSARDCLKFLWGQTQPGGYWFTHEASLPAYIEGVFDSRWWHRELKTCPPQVVGAYIGASPSTPSTAYFVKR